MLGHKTCLSIFKIIEIIQRLFHRQSGIELEIKNKNIWKSSKYLEVKQHTLINVTFASSPDKVSWKVFTFPLETA